MSSQSASVTLRPVGPDDRDFLLEVYGSTRAAEMAMVPWTDEQRRAFVQLQFDAQQEHYSKHYPDGNHDIILLDGRQVGRFYVARLDHEIRIVDITVLPAERNAGVGTYLLTQLLDEADRIGKMTRIYVEDFNPALALFTRLGFSPSEQNGFHLLLRRDPSQQHTPSL